MSFVQSAHSGNKANGSTFRFLLKKIACEFFRLFKKNHVGGLWLLQRGLHRLNPYFCNFQFFFKTGTMSAKKRILFIANEMSPYLELTEFSEVVNKLAIN